MLQKVQTINYDTMFNKTKKDKGDSMQRVLQSD